MFEAIYKGILLGLSLAFSFGPGFWALINTGIKSGFRPAASLAIGIFLSDVFLIILIFILLSLGASVFLSEPKHQSFIGVVGGIVLIVYGSFNFYSKPPKTEAQVDDSSNVNHLNIETNIKMNAEKILIKNLPQNSPKPFWLGVKGFFLNLLNPFVWLFWLATATAIGSSFQFSSTKIIIFFSSTLGVVLSTDLLKGFVAYKIKHFLTPKLMKFINYASGIIIIAFGLYLIYKMFFLQ